MSGFGETLSQAFRKLAGMSIVDKEAVEAILRDVQRGLLQADVDVELVAQLTDKVKKTVLAGKIPQGLTLKELFIKTLYDEVVSFLGKERGQLALKPQKILVVGLFGSGKTTTIGKLARWFRARGLSVGLVACDTFRAAAKDQLKQIGQKVGVPVYTEGGKPDQVAKKAMGVAKEDVLIFDSAGRDALDKALAKELQDLAKNVKPDEVLLVIPAELGQAARKQTEEFRKLVGITGLIITRMDGTAKGGGALAAASASGANVKFIGVGEFIEDLEQYDPQRFVSKLIGWGDIQGLLDKAKEVGVGTDKEAMERIVAGQFTLKDFMEQIASMQKMGPLSKVAEMIPGMSGMKLPAGMLDVQESKMKRWRNIIQSMAKGEQADPEIIKAARISRIAKGSGTSESDVRELLKYYKQIKKIMKMVKGGKAFKRGPLAQFAKQFGLPTE